MTGLRTLPEPEPTVVSDKVRDVMLFVLPALEKEAEFGLVEPDVPMLDDGQDGRFAKAYIWDEVPWMDLRHEVRDLMILAVPELASYNELSISDDVLPDDGMEACWIEGTIRTEAPQVQALAPAQEVAMVSAPAEVSMIAMAEIPVGLPMPSAGEDQTQFDEASLEQSATVIVEEPYEVPIDVVEEVPVADAIHEVVQTETETVTAQVSRMTSDVDAEEPAPITEEKATVMFSFGSQEIQRSGWRVCFSF